MTGFADPRKCAFLGRLDHDAQERLLARGNPRRYQAGEVILRQGESSGQIVVMLSGRVKVASSSADGYQAVFAIRGPGDILGELAAVDQTIHSATVTALEPVDAHVLSGDQFINFVAASPKAALVLSGLIARRLREANRRRLEFGAYPVLRRLAIILLEMEAWYGRDTADGGRAIDLALSQSELAGLVGSSLESVVKALRQLRGQQLIATNRRRITILDPAAMREVERGR